MGNFKEPYHRAAGDRGRRLRAARTTTAWSWPSGRSPPRARRRRTTVPEPSAPRPPDLVDRDFTASRPDQLWVADITYVRTWSGWAYVAFVLDGYSRMIVGWKTPAEVFEEQLRSLQQPGVAATG
ncbi:DDE-type integrase/transposase/recombinase [Streptomyces sp. NBC_00448]|uniref:DDE-type integrase/transposase/recombinase n=1 Tax=Streptomyces sp. NBC_00448 TaxID=2903652 RepID=UPI002E23D987